MKTLLQEDHELEEKILAKIKAVLAERKAAAQGAAKTEAPVQENANSADAAPEPEAKA